MYTIEVGQKFEFQLEFDNVSKEVAERAIITLQSKVSDPNKFSMIQYPGYCKVYAKVTIEDCTPILSMVKDELNAW